MYLSALTMQSDWFFIF